MDDDDHATLEMSLTIPDCEACLLRMKPTFSGWKCAGCGAELPYA